MATAGASLTRCASSALCAWTMRRYSTLSVRNTYPPAVVSAAALALAVWLRAWSLVIVAAPVTSFSLSAALCGRRWRLAARWAASCTPRIAGRRRSRS